MYSFASALCHCGCSPKNTHRNTLCSPTLRKVALSVGAGASRVSSTKKRPDETLITTSSVERHVHNFTAVRDGVVWWKGKER